jgi:hypothetical protein
VFDNGASGVSAPAWWNVRKGAGCSTSYGPATCWSSVGLTSLAAIIRKNSLAALAYAPTCSAKPVCCSFDHVSKKYLTQIMRLDGTYGTMSLGTEDDELAKDRMRLLIL